MALALALVLIVLGLGLGFGFEWSGLVNITASYTICVTLNPFCVTLNHDYCMF